MHLCSNLLDFLQYAHCFIVLGSSDVDTTLSLRKKLYEYGFYSSYGFGYKRFAPIEVRKLQNTIFILFSCKVF